MTNNPFAHLPTGIVTFLFTDIEGSTKIAQAHPDQWERIRGRHYDIVRAAIEANHGFVFQLVGDEFCSSFHNPVDALKAALTAQRGLQSEPWDIVPIKVRMGIHTGAAQVGDLLDRTGYVGYAALAGVNRVMSAGHGGQTLLSSSSAELARAELPEDVTLLDMGEHRLKGLLAAEHLWQVEAPGLLRDFPPLKTLTTIPNSQAEQLASFVEREKSIAVGLDKLEVELPQRAPVLLEKFQQLAEPLRASPVQRTYQERFEALKEMNNLCLEALDISFIMLCNGEEPPAYDARCPFRGLESFRPEDSRLFFGREALTNKILGKIQSHPFLAVLGMSGSGKSSLVMAGLIPALEAEYIIFRPGVNPLDGLESALSSVKENALIVVDQFEETFTLTSEEKIRKDFIARLLDATQRCKVVITLRSDFLGEAALYRALNDEIQNHLEIVPPMDMDELYHAMEGQASSTGLQFEADLGKQILDDVAGEPGAMPLLQHALWMLWKRRHGTWLMSEEYRAFGGIHRAIASTADELYETFSPEDRERMRNVFVRLTRLDQSGQTARDARQRVRVNNLIYRNDTLAQTMDFIRRLTNARLLITSFAALQNEEVEVAHEALIRNWPRLRGWLDEDRLSLLVQEDIREAASVWDASDNDNDAIVHRGGKLEDCLHLMRNPRSNLSMMEQKYLEACQKKEMGFKSRMQSALNKLILPILFFISVLAVILFDMYSNTQVYTALVVGTVIPLFIFFIIYRMDKYRIVEFKQALFCLLGGAAGYYLVARINPALLEYSILSQETNIRFVDPIIGTGIKGLLLYLILTRVKVARPVDGIIYGAAVGAGFAVVENYKYVFEYANRALLVATVRSLSTNLMHMVIGLSGYLFVIARYDKNKTIRFTKILAALILPSIIGAGFNAWVNSDFAPVWAIILFGLSVVILLCIIVRYFIKQDQEWTEQFLQTGTAAQGNTLLNKVQKIIGAIQNLFGKVRSSQFERFLILQARRAILQKSLQSMDDPKLRLPIEEQMTTVRKKIRGTRSAIGTYCWENVKAVIPELGRIAEN